MTHKSAPSPSPGPADGNALSGGYPVQPCSGAPPTTKKAEHDDVSEQGYPERQHVQNGEGHIRRLI